MFRSATQPIYKHCGQRLLIRQYSNLAGIRGCVKYLPAGFGWVTPRPLSRPSLSSPFSTLKSHPPTRAQYRALPLRGALLLTVFRGMIWNGIPSVCFYFCSTERNSKFFSLPRKDSERNCKSFLFRGTAGIPSKITMCSVYSVFC